MKSPESLLPVVLLLPLVLFAAILAFDGSLRENLRYGWLCLRRYPDLWRIPTLFSFGYTLFNIIIYDVVPERMGVHFNPWQTPDLNFSWGIDAFTDTLWPAAENMAGMFNCLVATFPLSFVVSLVYLANVGGVRSELHSAIHRRFPRFGTLVALGIIVTALAALLKPFFFLCLDSLTKQFNGWDILRIGNVAGALSFLFEYLLAAFLQVYLVLMAFAWVRGLSFQRSHLLHFSLRRLGYVLKWIGVISLPGFLILAVSFFFRVPDHYIPLNQFVQSIMVPALTIFMLVMASVQIILTLHNESLHQAIVDHFLFLRAHFWEIVRFAIAGILLFWQLKILLYGVQFVFGIYTLTGISSEVLEGVFRGLAGGWLLAAWVCLYHRWSGGKFQVPF